ASCAATRSGQVLFAGSALAISCASASASGVGSSAYKSYIAAADWLNRSTGYSARRRSKYARRSGLADWLARWDNASAADGLDGNRLTTSSASSRKRDRSRRFSARAYFIRYFG